MFAERKNNITREGAIITQRGDLEYGNFKGYTIILYTEFQWNFKTEFSLEFLIVWKFWIFLCIFCNFLATTGS